MSGNGNYFSWANISEMTDIDSHIRYATDLFNEYEWDDESRASLEKRLSAIADKQNDKLLNISVIGEFSTGKSSFINAIVGYELLAINAMQGTTVAITIIEFDKEFSITIYDAQGKVSTQSYESIQRLKDELHKYTTDPSYANQISHIKVTLPSEILKNGFRIIDTPGTNSLELWHEEITVRAINEMSDLSIILTAAQQAMPETFTTFIGKRLGDNIMDCAFIANKIDLIKEKERDGIIQFIETKVKHTFNTDTPLVLPFAAVALTNSFTDEKVDVDENSLILTRNSLQSLLSHAAKRKVQAQARKTLQLTDAMYSTLTKYINNIAEEYMQQLQLLERSKQTDLKPFIQQQINERARSFNDNIIEIQNSFYKKANSIVSEYIRKINKKIDGHTTLDSLNNYVKCNLSDEIEVAGKTAAGKFDPKYKEVKEKYITEITHFQEEFKNEFEKLNILPIEFKAKPNNIKRRISGKSANIGPVKELITQELSNENRAYGGGVVTGAAIGTMFAPGIGTFLGALAGLFAGGHFAPDVNEVKGKIKNKLKAPLKSYFSSVTSDCISNFNTYIHDVNSNIEKEINAYLSTYSSTVREEIKKWEEQQGALNKKINDIRMETDRIKTRQHSIRNIMNNIK